MPRRLYSLETQQEIAPEELHALVQATALPAALSPEETLSTVLIETLPIGLYLWDVLVSTGEGDFWMTWKLSSPQNGHFPAQEGSLLQYEGETYTLHSIARFSLHVSVASAASLPIRPLTTEEAQGASPTPSKKKLFQRKRGTIARATAPCPVQGGRSLPYYEVAIADLPHSLRSPRWPQWVRCCYFQLFVVENEVLVPWEVERLETNGSSPTYFRAALSPDLLRKTSFFSKEPVEKKVPRALYGEEAAALVTILQKPVEAAIPIQISSAAFQTPHTSISEHIYYLPVAALGLSTELTNKLIEAEYRFVGELLDDEHPWRKKDFFLQEMDPAELYALACALRDHACLPGNREELYFIPTSLTYEDDEFGTMRLVQASPLAIRLENRRHSGFVEPLWLLERQVKAAEVYSRAWKRWDSSEREERTLSNALAHGLLDPDAPLYPFVETYQTVDLEELHNRQPLIDPEAEEEAKRMGRKKENDPPTPVEIFVSQELLHEIISHAQVQDLKPEQTIWQAIAEGNMVKREQVVFERKILTPEQIVSQAIEHYLHHPEAQSPGWALSESMLSFLHEALDQDQQERKSLPRRSSPTMVEHAITIPREQKECNSKPVKGVKHDYVGSTFLIGILTTSTPVPQTMQLQPRTEKPLFDGPKPLVPRVPNYVLSTQEAKRKLELVA